MDWIEKNVTKAVAIVVFVLLAAAILVLHQCSVERTAKTETRLATGQAGAALNSGADAVGAVGNRQAADAAGDQTVMETKDAIDNATDAGGVTDAGRSGLCGLAGNRGKPECLRKPAAR
jgi:type II secretory pathway component PulM